MLFYGYLHTGRRCFAESCIESIDLWATDLQTKLSLADGTTIALDEDESRVIRDWAATAMQTAIVDNQEYLLERRCDLQAQLTRAAKVNRAASRARTKAARKPAQVAIAGQSVDTEVWKVGQADWRAAAEARDMEAFEAATAPNHEALT